MISYEEALQIIETETRRVGGRDLVSLQKAAGRVLAEPILAARPNPAFDNSAIDGYLLGQPTAAPGDSFSLCGELRAGSVPPYPTPGRDEALRIFTGAPVPEGDFSIVMQEDVDAVGETVTLNERAAYGDYMRRRGSDFGAKTCLVDAGRRVGPAEIALAAWNGLGQVSMFRALRVAILVTGDELVPPGVKPCEGQIHDSNGPMLEALTARTTPSTTSYGALPDVLSETKTALVHHAKHSDMIVVSGGASVGDHDHLPAAVESVGTVHFHKVSIKPGKPVLFGKIGECSIFALPGNPASAFVCFEIFVRPALRLLSGEAKIRDIWIPARFDGSHRAAGRDEFIRVCLEMREDCLWAMPVFEQGSFGMRSISTAHALARLTMGRSYESGEHVLVKMLPGAN